MFVIGMCHHSRKWNLLMLSFGWRHKNSDSVWGVKNNVKKPVVHITANSVLLLGTYTYDFVLFMFCFSFLSKNPSDAWMYQSSRRLVMHCGFYRQATISMWMDFLKINEPLATIRYWLDIGIVSYWYCRLLSQFLSNEASHLHTDARLSHPHSRRPRHIYSVSLYTCC